MTVTIPLGLQEQIAEEAAATDGSLGALDRVAASHGLLLVELKAVQAAVEARVRRTPASAPPAPSETRACSKCGTAKPLTEFYLNGPSKGGRMGVCRSCNNGTRRVTPTKVIRNRAAMRAHRVLAERHREEYEQLLQVELEKATAEHEALAAAAAARGNADAEVARIKPGPKSKDLGETSAIDRLDVARCPSCHTHHDAGHTCPGCGATTPTNAS